MWDNAPLLRGIAGALFFSSVLAMLYGAAHYAVHQPKLLPIKSVRLTDAPQRVVPAEVLAVVKREVHGNFLTVDIDRLRRQLEKLPWVRSVSVRREYPDRLAVTFEEHEAVARWNDVALVNKQGEVFLGDTEQKLPKFFGVDGSSHEMLQQYAKFSEQLSPLNLGLTELTLTPRHAWRLNLSNAMVVELGREAMEQRLARFVSVYRYSLLPIDGGLNRTVVDMRYRYGFTVKGRHA